MISFDVESLFTNVPLEPTLDFLSRKLSNFQAFIPLPIDILIDCIRLCVASTKFSFNGNFYEQQFGIAMGSPLSPILANLFLEMVESEDIPKYPGVSPSLWLRYVDDVLSFVPNSFNLH